MHYRLSLSSVSLIRGTSSVENEEINWMCSLGISQQSDDTHDGTRKLTSMHYYRRKSVIEFVRHGIACRETRKNDCSLHISSKYSNSHVSAPAGGTWGVRNKRGKTYNKRGKSREKLWRKKNKTKSQKQTNKSSRHTLWRYLWRAMRGRAISCVGYVSPYPGRATGPDFQIHALGIQDDRRIRPSMPIHHRKGQLYWELALGGIIDGTYQSDDSDNNFFSQH